MRRSEIKRKTPMRRRSKKTQRVYEEERIPLVQELLSKHPSCSARLKGCTRRATQVHEVKSRGRGGSIVNPENCVTLCDSCHRYITAHPKWAKEQEWLKSAWEEEARTKHNRVYRIPPRPENGGKMSDTENEEVEGKKGNWVTPKLPEPPAEPRNVPENGVGETLPAEDEVADQSSQSESPSATVTEADEVKQ